MLHNNLAAKRLFGEAGLAANQRYHHRANVLAPFMRSKVYKPDLTADLTTISPMTASIASDTDEAPLLENFAYLIERKL